MKRRKKQLVCDLQAIRHVHLKLQIKMTKILVGVNISTVFLCSCIKASCYASVYNNKSADRDGTIPTAIYRMSKRGTSLSRMSIQGLLDRARGRRTAELEARIQTTADAKSIFEAWQASVTAQGNSLSAVVRWGNNLLWWTLWRHPEPWRDVKVIIQGSKSQDL